ncbi:VRR-NUC domain-containing protein [Photobacterium sp. SDRW27]|uniref:VRR-NUC domain-containing protein n=1 Tax=Photobacterium obscurum TaxID=2829490 RepID=UPI002244BD8C|nr:VRR-NUC domain-containing protein [Photobacterium obscurum]MCW8331224.1 VRR-NUC domain-containing protein [Photobacterium obscurum]
MRLFPVLTGNKSARKPELTEILINHNPSFSDFGQDILQICHQQHLDTFLLLFFGNRHQDLSQFVLSDLGLHQFESYAIDRQTRLFSKRYQIQQWLELADLSDRYWQAKEMKDHTTITELATAIPPAFSWSPLERKRQQLINHIARDLERFSSQDKHQLNTALTLFRHSLIPPSRERQVRILDKQEKYDDAYQLALEMKASPYTEEEADVASTLERKLCSKLSLKIEKPIKPVFNEQHLVLPHQDINVEESVVNYYREQGWQSYFLENSLICSLFGLAFWDIIYSPVTGAFLNPYQRSPRDMFQPEFYEQRKQLIDDRLTDIESGNWRNWLAVFNEKIPLSNDWVNWNLINPEIITLSIKCIPPTVLCRLFRRILFDPRNNRSGFPDVIVFKDNQYKWVEVKGPGDKLQSNQIRWLKVFQELKVPAVVTYVTWEK